MTTIGLIYLLFLFLFHQSSQVTEKKNRHPEKFKQGLITINYSILNKVLHLKKKKYYLKFQAKLLRAVFSVCRSS